MRKSTASQTEHVEAPPRPPTARTQPSILVVEDEGIVAMDLKRSLSSLGYHVAGVAGSRREAIELSARCAPDLVLMDIKLDGEFDGLAAAEEIRRRWKIPVVFLTAYSNDEMLARARAVGAYGYLVKPFRGREIHAAILMALHQHRLANELFAEHTWLRTVLASLRDSVIATDAEGRVRYLNGAAESMLGWEQPEAVGKRIEDVFPVVSLGDPAIGKCQLREALDSREPVAKQRFMLATRGGRKVPIEDAASPILKDGQMAGAVSVFLDISERLAAEQRTARQHDLLTEKVESTAAELGQTRTELQALSRHLMSAQEEERTRVARELHDDLGHRTALLEIEVERLRGLLPDPAGEIRAAMTSLTARCRELADGLRDASHRLHPSVLEDLGLPAALRMLVDEVRVGSEDICLLTQGELPPLPLPTRTALYRIVQEALRNARRHAPQAPVRIELGVSPEPHELCLSIEDAGPGFDLQRMRTSGGLGLLSMQERAYSIGGRIEIDTAPQQGTRICVRVPQPAAVE